MPKDIVLTNQLLLLHVIFAYSRVLSCPQNKKIGDVWVGSSSGQSRPNLCSNVLFLVY